ncbi:hypothetical protein JNE12002_32950 [Escherichia coli]|uniref:hypothetical protein n=1 Tax=Enterobacteriaceae TaxID=543 RepID=UPI000DD5F175|nr:MULTISPECIES: hypothetical protein [Enterobacteriaceae]KAF3715744.1 hypothetical protein FM737_002567 [Escherichia marmotae]MBV7606576.1 hypothetical protein [Escherichia coli]MBV7611551.1 hypothetical protein [Escherichia coli]MBV7616274.1 hypothetical protein [Escherichia coli]HAI5968189.1 hypothetical protein [Escherichia coli]
MKIIKNIPSLPDVEVTLSSRTNEIVLVHNTKTGHTVVENNDSWYEGNTDKKSHWGDHIDDAAAFHSFAQNRCTNPTTKPDQISDLALGTFCFHNVLEEDRVFENTDYHAARLSGIGRVVPTDYNSVTVYDPNNNPPTTITGDAAEIIVRLLSMTVTN